MNTRGIAQEYRLQQWAKALQEKAQSGQSVVDFCQSREISRNAYFYWQRKLRTVACTHAQQAAKSCEDTENKLVPSGWAVCEDEKPSALPAGAIDISIGKCHITATADTDMRLLGRVIRTLADIC